MMANLASGLIATRTAEPTLVSALFWRALEPRTGGPTPVPVPPNPLERMVQLVRSNDQLTRELERSRGRVVQARLAADRASGQSRLETLYLDHCKTKHRGILAQLRANRIEATRLLGLPTSAGSVRA